MHDLCIEVFSMSNGDFSNRASQACTCMRTDCRDGSTATTSYIPPGPEQLVWPALLPPCRGRAHLLALMTPEPRGASIERGSPQSNCAATCLTSVRAAWTKHSRCGRTITACCRSTWTRSNGWTIPMTKRSERTSPQPLQRRRRRLCATSPTLGACRHLMPLCFRGGWPHRHLRRGIAKVTTAKAAQRLLCSLAELLPAVPRPHSAAPRWSQMWQPSAHGMLLSRLHFETRGRSALGTSDSLSARSSCRRSCGRRQHVGRGSWRD